MSIDAPIQKPKDEEALDMLYLAVTRAKCYIEENHKVCEDRAKAEQELTILKGMLSKLEEENEHLEGRFELEHNAKVSLQNRYDDLNNRYEKLIEKNTTNIRDLTAAERDASEYKAALEKKCESCLMRKSYALLSELSDVSKALAYKLIERLYAADCGEDDGR